MCERSRLWDRSPRLPSLVKSSLVSFPLFVMACLSPPPSIVSIGWSCTGMLWMAPLGPLLHLGFGEPANVLSCQLSSAPQAPLLSLIMSLPGDRSALYLLLLWPQYSQFSRSLCLCSTSSLSALASALSHHGSRSCASNMHSTSDVKLTALLQCGFHSPIFMSFTEFDGLESTSLLDISCLDFSNA